MYQIYIIQQINYVYPANKTELIIQQLNYFIGKPQNKRIRKKPTAC